MSETLLLYYARRYDSDLDDFVGCNVLYGMTSGNARLVNNFIPGGDGGVLTTAGLWMVKASGGVDFYSFDTMGGPVAYLPGVDAGFGCALADGSAVFAVASIGGGAGRVVHIEQSGSITFRELPALDDYGLYTWPADVRPRSISAFADGTVAVAFVGAEALGISSKPLAITQRFDPRGSGVIPMSKPEVGQSIVSSGSGSYPMFAIAMQDDGAVSSNPPYTRLPGELSYLDYDSDVRILRGTRSVSSDSVESNYLGFQGFDVPEAVMDAAAAYLGERPDSAYVDSRAGYGEVMPAAPQPEAFWTSLHNAYEV